MIVSPKEVRVQISKEAAHYFIQSDNAFLICGLGVAYCMKSNPTIGIFKRYEVEGQFVSSDVYNAALYSDKKTVIIGKGGILADANFVLDKEENEALKVLKEREQSLISSIEGIQAAESYAPCPISDSERKRLKKYKVSLKQVQESIKKLEESK
jgi:hypothetical protein